MGAYVKLLSELWLNSKEYVNPFKIKKIMGERNTFVSVHLLTIYSTTTTNNKTLKNSLTLSLTSSTKTLIELKRSLTQRHLTPVDDLTKWLLQSTGQLI